MTSLRHRKNRISQIFGIGLLVLLAGCSWFEEEESPWLSCPEIYRVGPASELVRFNDDAQNIQNIDFRVAIDRPQSECYFMDEEAIETHMRIPFLLRRGAGDEDRLAAFQYFIAISDISQGSDRILKREVFEVEAFFEGNEPLLEWVEEIDPFIPIAQGNNGTDYRIYIGLVLTPEERAYMERTR